MCGIVAAIAKREVSEILLEGLRRLEYRGYDSAGMAMVDNDRGLQLHKYSGKVAILEDALRLNPMQGCVGIAHTRWATHGQPNAINAHPHVSANRIALVHNGIIENHQALRTALEADGEDFLSQTDTEVIVHLIARKVDSGATLFEAVQWVTTQLEGAYALAVIDAQNPDQVVVAREGSPLVLGVGIGETFAGSDTLALRPVTDTFIYLEEGDVATLEAGKYTIYNRDGVEVERRKTRLQPEQENEELGDYEHYMLKETHEQPARLNDTLSIDFLDASIFGENAAATFSKVKAVQILACGTSYHAGLVARHWIEERVGIPCQVEVASEYRYRKSVTLPGTLIVTLSQSGETADTLAALKIADNANVVGRLAICNVDHSAIVRASDLVFLTRAGAEIGVASTKAFTTQLAALLVLTANLAHIQDAASFDKKRMISAFSEIPLAVTKVLALESRIQAMAVNFITKHHA